MRKIVALELADEIGSSMKCKRISVLDKNVAVISFKILIGLLIFSGQFAAVLVAVLAASRKSVLIFMTIS
jgi:hypothetical protein